MNFVMDSDLTIRRATLLRGASTSKSKSSSRAKKFKYKPQLQMCDPEGQFTAPSRNRNTRHPPERWPQWELDFVEKCFETTRYPSSSLQFQWASTLAEKRLRHVGPSHENNENMAKDWVSHYKRRVANWFKNRKAKLRREGGNRTEEDPEDVENDVESPLASPPLDRSMNQSSTVVQQYTMEDLNDGVRVSSCHDSLSFIPFQELCGDSPESEEGQSISEEVNDTIRAHSLDDEVSHDGSQMGVLASFQQPVSQLMSACHLNDPSDNPFFDSEGRPPLTFPVSACRDEPRPNIAMAVDDGA